MSLSCLKPLSGSLMVFGLNHFPVIIYKATCIPCPCILYLICFHWLLTLQPPTMLSATVNKLCPLISVFSLSLDWNTDFSSGPFSWIRHCSFQEIMPASIGCGLCTWVAVFLCKKLSPHEVLIVNLPYSILF